MILEKEELVKQEIIRYLMTDYQFPIEEVELRLQLIYNKYHLRRKARYTDLYNIWHIFFRVRKIQGINGKIKAIIL